MKPPVLTLVFWICFVTGTCVPLVTAADPCGGCECENKIVIWCSDNLSSLGLSNRNLVGFKEKPFHNFNKQIYAQNNKIVLKPYQFISASGLIELHMSYNSLTSLPGELFRYNSDRLDTLVFSHNLLSTLPSNLFRGNTRYKSVRHLDLKHNILEYLPPGIFDGISRTLKVLILGNNKLTTIQDVFRNLGQLEALLINDNQLVEINQWVFSHVKNLKFLILSGNKLTSISNLAFQTLTYIEQIDLSRNKLTVLADSTFDGLDKLTTLKLMHNHLENFPDYLVPHTNLNTNIALEGNPFAGNSSLCVHKLDQRWDFGVANKYIKAVPCSGNCLRFDDCPMGTRCRGTVGQHMCERPTIDWETKIDCAFGHIKAYNKVATWTMAGEYCPPRGGVLIPDTADLHHCLKPLRPAFGSKYAYWTNISPYKDHVYTTDSNVHRMRGSIYHNPQYRVACYTAGDNVVCRNSMIIVHSQAKYYHDALNFCNGKDATLLSNNINDVDRKCIEKIVDGLPYEFWVQKQGDIFSTHKGPVDHLHPSFATYSVACVRRPSCVLDSECPTNYRCAKVINRCVRTIEKNGAVTYHIHEVGVTFTTAYEICRKLEMRLPVFEEHELISKTFWELNWHEVEAAWLNDVAGPNPNNPSTVNLKGKVKPIDGSRKLSPLICLPWLTECGPGVKSQCFKSLKCLDRNFYLIRHHKNKTFTQSEEACNLLGPKMTIPSPNLMGCMEELSTWRAWTKPFHFPYLERVPVSNSKYEFNVNSKVGNWYVTICTKELEHRMCQGLMLYRIPQSKNYNFYEAREACKTQLGEMAMLPVKEGPNIYWHDQQNCMEDFTKSLGLDEESKAWMQPDFSSSHSSAPVTFDDKKYSTTEKALPLTFCVLGTLTCGSTKLYLLPVWKAGTYDYSHKACDNFHGMLPSISLRGCVEKFSRLVRRQGEQAWMHKFDSEYRFTNGDGYTERSQAYVQALICAKVTCRSSVECAHGTECINRRTGRTKQNICALAKHFSGISLYQWPMQKQLNWGEAWHACHAFGMKLPERERAYKVGVALNDASTIGRSTTGAWMNYHYRGIFGYLDMNRVYHQGPEYTYNHTNTIVCETNPYGVLQVIFGDECRSDGDCARYHHCLQGNKGKERPNVCVRKGIHNNKQMTMLYWKINTSIYWSDAWTICHDYGMKLPDVHHQSTVAIDIRGAPEYKGVWIDYHQNEVVGYLNGKTVYHHGSLFSYFDVNYMACQLNHI